jgi:hypothetical protein
MAVAGCLRSEPTGVHTAVMITGRGELVLDTNVFVAAGFNPGSSLGAAGRSRAPWAAAYGLGRCHPRRDRAGDAADPALVMDSYRGPVSLRGQVRRFSAS